MDMPRDENDLSNDPTDVERRLAGWQPATRRLDADAMLFAAGRAAGRRGPGRWLWPASTALLAIVAGGLAVWGLSERAERQTLASQLRERATVPGLLAIGPGVATVPAPAYSAALDDYLHLRRMMEEDPNAWPTTTQVPGAPGDDPPPQPPILTPRPRDDALPH